ncbi:TsaC protein [Cutibacterium acnes JCM 18918]|nr:TsaC protein [Cutibacterium acnes JCM 18918]
MDETDQTMVNTDELAGPVAEEKSTVSGIEPRGDAALKIPGFPRSSLTLLILIPVKTP